MRVLVCGGRDYTDKRRVAQILDEIDPTLVIHGGARGADFCASFWAVFEQVPEQIFRADWKMHGRKAGPIRNSRMLAEGSPDLVVAFPGGSGTADMVRKAKAAGVPVREIAE